MKTRTIILFLILFLGLLGLASRTLAGSTYYVCDIGSACLSGSANSDWTTGNDSNACTARSAPCKTLNGGIVKMSGGDTLIIGNGTYKGGNNFVGDYASTQYYPPSGTSKSNMTTIKAENIAGVTLDGQYTNPVFCIANHPNKVSYLHLDGIIFANGNGGVFFLYGDYDWISNCGFHDGQASSDESESPIAAFVGGSSYGLLEDSWIWGKGRYGFYSQPGDPNNNDVGTSHMIFRRNVVRLDNTPSQWMTAGLRFYGSSTNTMQNNIVIDGNFNNSSGEFHGLATGGGSSSSDNSDTFVGNIVLHNGSWDYPSAGQFTPQTDCIDTEKGTGTYTYQNNVCWGNYWALDMDQNFETPFTVNWSNGTIGQNAWLDVRQNYDFPLNMTRDVFFTMSGASTFYNNSGTISATAPEYAYLASGATEFSAGSVSNVTLESSSATQSSLDVSGLMYLPRIESGSTLGNAGVGATVLNQIGGTGTFYGDTGWNTTTSTPLWPWKNESIWTPILAAYNASGPGGARGFAAGGNDAWGQPLTLTRYIWEYLGNKIPDSIYGTSSDTTPPAAPSGLSVL